ncbi:MAG: hypothetical protein ACR2OZ_20760 [Verrucomicrobiales bacterium]
MIRFNLSDGKYSLSLMGRIRPLMEGSDIALWATRSAAKTPAGPKRQSSLFPAKNFFDKKKQGQKAPGNAFPHKPRNALGELRVRLGIIRGVDGLFDIHRTSETYRFFEAMAR